VDAVTFDWPGLFLDGTIFTRISSLDSRYGDGGDTDTSTGRDITSATDAASAAQLG
jgi:hypothetical protein